MMSQSSVPLNVGPNNGPLLAALCLVIDAFFAPETSHMIRGKPRVFSGFGNTKHEDVDGHVVRPECGIKAAEGGRRRLMWI
jgi:hypothetical protein